MECGICRAIERCEDLIIHHEELRLDDELTAIAAASDKARDFERGLAKGEAIAHKHFVLRIREIKKLLQPTQCEHGENGAHPKRT